MRQKSKGSLYVASQLHFRLTLCFLFCTSLFHKSVEMIFLKCNARWALPVALCFVFCSNGLKAQGDTNGDGIVKILAIGNSFSADAIENNLFDLAKEKGIKTVIANLYIGGAPLSLHVENVNENKAVYSMRKTAADGSRTTTANVPIETALADEEWDYVSFQQASPLSGQLATVEASLPALYQYVKARVSNPNVQYLWHQTWAYSQHAVHTGFANYGRDQLTMYRAIAQVSKQVEEVVAIDKVIPAGTAIQNARTSYLGDNFDRDGYHLRLPLGRYVAACTWFEKIFGLNVVGMQYKPSEITDLERALAQTAAHYAVQKPFEVTPLAKFRRGPKGAKSLSAPVLVDFGGTSHEGAWNPIITPLAVKDYALNDSLGNPTRLVLTTETPFSGKNGNGAQKPVTAYRFPKEVTSTSYHGSRKPDGSGTPHPEVKLKLSGLNKKHSYDLVFFASHMADSLGVLETRVVCNGATLQEGNLNAAGNTGELLELRDVKAARDGTLTITVSAGPGNTNRDGLYYLSAMRVSAGRSN